MRKLAITTVLLGFAALASAQENPAKNEPQKQQGGNWFTRMWSSGDKPPAKKTAATPKKSEPSLDDIAADVRAKEEAALNRRNDVILKLREIALHTHDDLLLRKADDLEQRAWVVYLQKTSGMDSRGFTSGVSEFVPAKDRTAEGEKR